MDLYKDKESTSIVKSVISDILNIMPADEAEEIQKQEMSEDKEDDFLDMLDETEDHPVTEEGDGMKETSEGTPINSAEQSNESKHLPIESISPSDDLTAVL